MFSVVLLGSCAKEGCTDPQATNYDADATKDDGSCNPPAIGSFYQGGIIFYLDGVGGGLVAASSDQVTWVYPYTGGEWGCFGEEISGANNEGLGYGIENTLDIVNSNCSPTQQSDNPIAANFCNALILEGYSDWFLPSKDELHMMYQNIGPGNQLSLGNVGNFKEEDYWSSTEIDYNEAWMENFFNGSQKSVTKLSPVNVRAIRSF